MHSITISDVPDDVLAVLRRRADAAGQPLEAYLLAQLAAAARRLTADEVLARAGGRAGGSVGFAAAVAVLRAEREQR